MRVGRPFALTATAAMLAMTVAMAFGAGASFAKTETKEAHYYEDGGFNLCVGLPTSGLFTGSCEWAKMTGSDNVGVGPYVLSANTTGEGNVASGAFALFSNTTGKSNTASGEVALFSNTTGIFNTASGSSALSANTTGNSNVASGTAALFANTTGDDNVASGVKALFDNTGGKENVAIGDLALSSNTTGNENVAIGPSAGENLTSGSNNIDISNEGVAGEEGTTRIGREGKQTKAIIAGIHGKTLAGSTCSVDVNTEGQLGCTTGASAGSAAIATFASFGGVVSGHCLNYTELEGQGQGNCPTKTSGFADSTLLAGPTPENGATVTNLYADSNATVTGTDTVLLAVIDNTTGATLLSCTVNSTTVNHCSNASGSGSAAAGDNIEVKVTATGSSGNHKSWRVRFRY